MSFPKARHGPSRSMGTLGVVNMVDQGAVNDMRICPYNESNVVSGGRYQSHLIACRKAQGYTDDSKSDSVKVGDDASEAGASAAGTSASGSTKKPPPIVQCPYNASHLVNRSVLKKHVLHCESYYKHCMGTQPDPPGTKDKACLDRGEKSAGDSSTDTDSEDESHYIPKIEWPTPEELAKSLEEYLLLRDHGLDKHGNPFLFTTPSETDSESEDDDWFSVSSHCENNNIDGDVVNDGGDEDADNATATNVDYDSAVE